MSSSMAVASVVGVDVVAIERADAGDVGAGK
jgi:hypothetical protein